MRRRMKIYLQFYEKGREKQISEEISKGKRPCPTRPPANLCTHFRVVLLQNVYSNQTEIQRSENPRSLSVRSFFHCRLNFIVNKNARPNSLGSLGYFDTV